MFQEDINQFWKLQEGRQPVVVENAHNIIAAAAVHFNEVCSLFLVKTIEYGICGEYSHISTSQKLLSTVH